MTAVSTLPDDIEALKRLLLQRDATIARLITEIARLKRWHYGRSAERLDGDARAQMPRALGDLQAAHAPAVAAPPALPVNDSTQACDPAQTNRRASPATRSPQFRRAPAT